MGSLINLGWLYLFDNELSGALPSELTSLVNLGYLNLSDTQLCAPTGDVFQAWLRGISDKTGVVNCAEPDRAILVALYEATDGANWWNNTNWLSDKPLSEWYGVYTDDNGRVTQLLLSGNELSGPIPSSLGGLTHLRVLHLYSNALSGPIPSSLGDLTHLQELYLYSNALSGSIPSSLVSLIHLRVLYLFDNELSGALPSELTGLDNLRYLNLSDTQLCAPTGDVFQAWLRDISDKTGVVNCAEPDRAILVALYEATDGANWWNNTNWLSDKPLSEWYGVDTDDNGRVIQLLLSGNELSGPIPSSLGGLTHLRVLLLYGNELSGFIPSSLGDLAHLQVLYLYSNELSGLIPSSLGGLTHLQELRLSGNKLSGLIPSSLGGLTHLRVLNLSRNELSGSIPSSLDSLTHLNGLYLSENELSGCVPDALRNVPHNDFTQLGLPFCAT